MGNSMNGKKKLDSPESSGKKIVGQRNRTWYPEDTTFSPDFEIDLNRVLAENEWLKQELYADQSLETSILMNKFLHHNWRLKHFVQVIEDTSKLTGIRKQDIYGIIYSTLQWGYGITWKDKKPTESKLKFLWRLGYFPHAMLTLKSLYDVLLIFEKTAQPQFKTLVQEIQRKIDKRKKVTLTTAPSNIKGSTKPLKSLTIKRGLTP